MSLEAILVAGTIVKMETDPVAAPDTFDRVIPGITSFGAVGETGESKDKTTLSSTVKEYGAAIKDTPEQTIQGQYYSTDANQRAFVTAARAQENRKIQITWPDGTEAVITLQLLGFQINEGTSEDWQMFTVQARQSGAVAWTDPATV